MRVLDENRVIWSRMVMEETQLTSQNMDAHADARAENEAVLARVGSQLAQADGPSQMGDNRLMTLQDVARQLAVSTRTVSRIVARGELRAVYLTPPNRTMRFERQEVKKFIDSRVEVR
jgi:excisionase family DNA binding protein